MNAIEQSDNELVYMIRCGSKEAFESLSYKYEKIIKKYIYDYFQDTYIYGFDLDDIMEECLITFYDVLFCFNERKGIFYTYVMQSIRFRIYDLIKFSFCSKNNGFNYVTSDLLCYDISNLAKNIDSYSRCDEESHPVNQYILRETTNVIFGENSNLLEIEKQILSLKVMGFSVNEISNKLNINRKRIEYIIRNAREKIKDIL